MIIAVDGNNICYAACCIDRLSRADGFPTQAIVGFYKYLHHLAEEHQPQKIFVAFDGSRSRRRMEILPEYKAGRYEEMTPQQELLLKEFKLQMPLIQGSVPHVGAFTIMGPGVEADDLIAMVVHECEKLGEKILIASNDKDFLQLVSPQVSVLRSKGKLVTDENMEKSYGLKSSQWLDFRCIVGDTSDNIKGVPGAGEKTAQGILQKYGTLEAFFDAPRKIVNTREKKVLESSAIIARNRRLMGLRSFEGPYNAQIIPPTNDRATLKQFFVEYEMRSIYLDFPRWISAFNCLGDLPGKAGRE